MLVEPTIAARHNSRYTRYAMEQFRPATTDHVQAPAQEASDVVPEFGPRDFRNALGRFATGITVVTMRAPAEDASGAVTHEEQTFGITVNAFMSVSLDPPLIAVSVDKRARAHGTMLTAERFGISVLAAGQERLSDVFAGRPVEPPAEPFEQFAAFPVVRGALTQLVLSTYQAHDAGDHTIFVGKVEALRYSEGQPLLFFKGQYEQLPAAQPVG